MIQEGGAIKASAAGKKAWPAPIELEGSKSNLMGIDSADFRANALLSKGELTGPAGFSS